MNSYDVYYYIDDHGEITGVFWGDDKYLDERRSIGNVFKTKEDAEKMLIKIKAYVIKKEEENE